jgi:hypothetical protein
MTDLKELTGTAPDPDCLHCYLPPLITAWHTAHPHVDTVAVLIQLSQVLCEP